MSIRHSPNQILRIMIPSLVLLLLTIFLPALPYRKLNFRSHEWIWLQIIVLVVFFIKPPPTCLEMDPGPTLLPGPPPDAPSLLLRRRTPTAQALVWFSLRWRVLPLIPYYPRPHHVIGPSPSRRPSSGLNKLSTLCQAIFLFQREFFLTEYFLLTWIFLRSVCFPSSATYLQNKNPLESFFFTPHSMQKTPTCKLIQLNELQHWSALLMYLLNFFSPQNKELWK